MSKTIGFTPDFVVRLPILDENADVAGELVEYNVLLNVPVEVTDGRGVSSTFEYMRVSHEGKMVFSTGSGDLYWCDLLMEVPESCGYDGREMYKTCVAGDALFVDRTTEAKRLMFRGSAGYFSEREEDARSGEDESKSSAGDDAWLEMNDVELTLFLPKDFELPNKFDGSVYPIPFDLSGLSVEELLDRLFDFGEEDEDTGTA